MDARLRHVARRLHPAAGAAPPHALYAALHPLMRYTLRCILSLHLLIHCAASPHCTLRASFTLPPYYTAGAALSHLHARRAERAAPLHGRRLRARAVARRGVADAAVDGRALARLRARRARHERAAQAAALQPAAHLPRGDAGHEYPGPAVRPSLLLDGLHDGGLLRRAHADRRAAARGPAHRHQRGG
eukprot:scaffold59617_cov79-Phaeocystis_antarctica.AAC.2